MSFCNKINGIVIGREEKTSEVFASDVRKPNANVSTMSRGKLLHHTKVAFTMDENYSNFTSLLNTAMHYLGGV